MFGLVHCNASIVARENTDPNLFFVRTLVKNWLWPIITFFGLTGNILAIIVLTKRRMIMSSTNNYLVALALVDIAYLLLTLTLNTLQHPCFMDETWSEIISTICRPIADFSSNTSVWLTVTFTVERWVAITYPLQSRTWCTIARARKIIVSVLCASLLCTSPSAFETKLVRVITIQNATNPNESAILTSRIRAKQTALGNSQLYHQIYFNFVTFAIIWIPLLLLIFFNTILIYYVHRSKQSERKNSEGIKLRRHNRGSQGEQQKTTIMLIAVVIVFTVCQIPQAISLTVQSFFPNIARTPKVLMYNNFANCLVAVNASTNFILYCCFSDRFRSTFHSSFACFSKYCAHFIQPSWKRPSNFDAFSLESMSLTGVPNGTNRSSYSLYHHTLGPRLSAISETDPKQHHLMANQTFHRPSQMISKKSSIPLPREQSRRHHFEILSLLKTTKTSNKQKNRKKKNLDRLSTESCPNSQMIKNSSFLIRQSSNKSTVLTTDDNGTVPSTNNDRIILSSTRSCESSSSYSSFMQGFNRSISKIDTSKYYPNGRLKKTLSNTRFSAPSRPIYHSFRSLADNVTDKEQIWVKRHRSNDAVEKRYSQQKSLVSNEIVDVTV